MAEPMTVLGIGTDIAECARIAKMIETHGETFLRRVFTAREIAYCHAQKSATERFTGRWTAKEAVLKALGTGWRRGISWLDIEVRNEPSGRPMVALGGAAREQALRLEIGQVLISISHCRAYAVAYALAVRDGGPIPLPATADWPEDLC